MPIVMVVWGIVAAVVTIWSWVSGAGYREDPWIAFAIWTATVWIIWVLFVVGCRNPSVEANLGRWFGKVWQFGTKDNTSANALAVAAVYFWISAFCYGLPTFGPDLEGLIGDKINVAESVKTARDETKETAGEVKNFLAGKGGITAIERILGNTPPASVPPAQVQPEPLRPRYPKGGWLWMVAGILTLLAVVDFFLSRRDEVGAWIGGVVAAMRRKSQTPAVVTSDGATGGKPSATATVAVAGKPSVWDDVVGAAIWDGAKGFLKRFR